MGGGVPDVSLFLFRADQDVDIVGIIIGNEVAPRGGLGGGVCRQRGRRTYWIYILERLAIEVRLAINVLNRMLDLGASRSEPIHN